MNKRCIICGCIMYDDTDAVICECCEDDMREDENGTGEDI